MNLPHSAARPLFTALVGSTSPSRQFIAAIVIGLVLAAAGVNRPNETDLVNAADAGELKPTPLEMEIPTPAAAAPTEVAQAPPSSRPVTVALAGDVHGEGGVGAALAAGLNPFAQISPALSAADVAIVNLETVVSTAGTPADKSFTFNANPALLASLAAAGVDVVSLANNHTLDYGPDALRETIDLAQAAGLRTVGAGSDGPAAYAPAVIDAGGWRVAVVGLSRVLPTPEWFASEDHPGVASAYDESAAVAAVRAATGLADHVVVTVHWGDELAACPDAEQLRLADALIAAGADVLAGHHPHVLQGIEIRQGAVVAYSLGNLAFYARSPQTRATGVLTLTLDQRGATSPSFFPAMLEDGIPIPADGVEATTVLDLIEARSPGGTAGCAFG